MSTYPNLLNARTTSGNGTAITLKRPLNVPREGSIFIFGTFDGCTVTLQDSMDGTEWFDLPSGAFTVKSRVNLQTHAKQLRAVVSSAGASTSVSAHFE